MAWIFCGILLIIIIFLVIQNSKKQILDKTEVKQLQKQHDDLVNSIRENAEIWNTYQEKIIEIKDRYNKELQKKTTDLDIYFENQKQSRQNELDLIFAQQEKTRQENLNLKIQELNKNAQAKLFSAQLEVDEEIKFLEKTQQDIQNETSFQQKRFESLLEPIKKYEMEQQQRLFYTIQVPDEYKEDINFLLNTVSLKVNHPDIINKLIWATYVKPYLDDTYKRVGIEEKAGIYKITSLIDNKCYIGKSTNIKKRISDHFKSVVKISTIADQAVHHEILKQGYWNWTIEPIIYCDKEQLNELEKYYIKFFQSNIYGWNKNEGG